MKNQHYPSARQPGEHKPKPIFLIISTVLWFFLTMILFKTNHYTGPEAGRVFLSRVTADPTPGKGSNGGIPGAMPSPTLYIPQAPKATGGYAPISFSELSGFFYWNPIDYIDGDPNPAKETRDKSRSKVPMSVMAYNGKKIAITGFMIPVDEDEKYVVQTFILAKSQMTCCYGATPLPNEWLFATMAPKTSKVMDQMDVPLTVYGTLSINPGLTDAAMPTLYKMTVNKVEGPKKSWF
jgi:hypothetical protein